MIFLFRIISDENPDFYRDLVADGTDTFLELHHTLQEDLGYDPTLLASFFITNRHWEKEQEITLIDMMQEPGIGSQTMEQVTLEEYLHELNQRMIYLFDFFSDRAFFIELIEMSDKLSPRDTPFVAHRQGEPPSQLALDDLMTEDRTEADEFDPLDGPDNLNIDDLDPDTFGNGMPEDF